ncbi:glycosyltransferase family 24 protein [Auriscalpium vulgare]|uniref:Glycosyltransferase family 24 protein n=1 Tax=Auriscalpium vulgare TaxID=40419 RepID=A0ACB8RDI7_9AGAM|nr:glycosyltransferase family 24 protein [Auriscalpium vulgare]
MKGLLHVASIVAGAYAASPPVRVSLRSSWAAPPYLLELIETLALDDPGAFFPLLDDLTDPKNLPGAWTPEMLREEAFHSATAKQYLSNPGSHQIQHLELGLHSTTPKIEAFYQYYRDTAEVRAAARDAESCGSWVDWYGELVCDPQRLEEVVNGEAPDAIEESTSNSPSAPHVLPFDHVYPHPESISLAPNRTAILYADITSPNFRALHSHLYSLSKGNTPQLQYVFRPIPKANGNAPHTSLSGFGVALDLKKMDYLALDDRHTHRGSDSGEDARERLMDVHPEADHVLPLLERYELNTTLDAAVPLTEDELSRLGSQAIQLVKDSVTPLATLKQLVQDFPKYAASLARRVVVDGAITEEIAQNAFKIQPGAISVWLNGAVVSDGDMNPFSILDLIKKEREIVTTLTAVGVEPSEVVDVLTHPALTAASASRAFDDVFDASDRPEDGDLIIYWNDIEKDSRYARWQTSLYALMRPMYPGQVPGIKLNLFHTILAMDLSKTDSLQFLTNTVTMVISRLFPVRFGLVPLLETDASAKAAKLFYYTVENYGRSKTVELFKQIAELPTSINGRVDLVGARALFEEVLGTAELKDGGVALDFDAVVDSEVDTRLEKARAYASRLGLAASGTRGHVFINGQYYVLDDTFLTQLQGGVTKALVHLQEAMYAGTLSEESTPTISTYFYDLPEAHTRRNPHIVPSTNAGGARMISTRILQQHTGFRFGDESFIYSPAEQVPSSIYLVADLDTEEGLGMVQTALTFLESPRSRSRVTFVHNPTSSSSEIHPLRRVSALFSHLIYQEQLGSISPQLLLQALGLHTRQGEEGQKVLSPAASLDKIMGGVDVEDVNVENYEDYIRTSAQVVKRLGLLPGSTVLVLNGRIVGPLSPGDFNVDDIHLLEGYEMAKRIEPVITALKAHALGALARFEERHARAHLISQASSLISSLQVAHAAAANQQRTFRTQSYATLDGKHTTFSIGDRQEAIHRFVVVLDPLSEQAQRYTSLFEWLSEIPTVHVEFYLQPAPYDELPLKRFYRYNLLTKHRFNKDGEEIVPEAVFRDLPVDPIYTLALDEPTSWLVRPKKALYDLDNIQLGVLTGDDRHNGVEAIFELDYLVAGGHARESNTNSPPRGVQLQLTTSDSAPVDDTLVVANLGYLQFKVKPGVYQLEIREGRGREVFKLESAGNTGWDSGTVDAVGSEITVTSFKGLTLYPRLARLPGKETADVLEEEEEEKEPVGLVDDVVTRITSLFRHKEAPSTSVSTSRHADINIFTVASGLLYERFASIMILSVLRNTKHSVKFWFIENFLSPSFLEFIPHFAEEYGFQYELVTYKWPTWLRRQKEKQRIIWAYKILFLDVLFPMDLDKVIFVDADQIVRADLKELIDLDLQGAPYGYTPMGDDNTDMEGYRFWKTGYWADFLRGRPYHISALYVVDLVRFRQMAAGDILRSQYQQLSADPNSLANLDQGKCDTTCIHTSYLPNNLQGHIPIYSLHEDWLWCETWCTKDRLNRAKTIDLCQNPLTKEPKLSRARQIPEWEVYDSEIAGFARRLADEGRILGSAAVADINELANAGVTAPPAVTDAAEEADEAQESIAPPLRDEL